MEREQRDDIDSVFNNIRSASTRKVLAFDLSAPTMHDTAEEELRAGMLSVAKEDVTCGGNTEIVMPNKVRPRVRK